VLVNLKPVGNGYMENFFGAGDLDGVLHQLKDKLHLHCKDVTGQSLEERLNNSSKNYVDQSIIYSNSKPISKMGGLIALFGSLAPEGAILKRASATPKLLEHEGKAVVFSSLEDLSKRIDDPDLDVTEEDILVLQNAGPSSNAGMPEAGYLPIPKKLAEKGVKDMVRISDARMSGTAFGTIILHVTPESHKDGPLGIIKNGDRIKLSASNKSIDLLISNEEMLSRISNIRREKNNHKRGYKSLYQQSVLPATEGCDFDFL
jgi:dihydroxy-acid dehydratase